SCLSFAVSFAMKISFAHLLILAVGVFWLKYRWSLLTKFYFWGFLLVALLPAGLWYYHARQLYFETGLSFDIWNFSSGRWGNLATWTDPSFYWNLLVMKLGQKHLTWSGLILLWLAVFRPPKLGESSRILRFWLISELAFFLVVANGNWVHDFYQLPFVPLGALFLGNLLGEAVSDTMNKKLKILAISLFVLILPFSAVSTKRFFKLPKEKDNLMELAQSVKKLTPRQSRLVTLQTLPDATLLYLCDRKGWQLTVAETPVRKLPELSGPEPVYIAGLKRDFEEPFARERLGEYIQSSEIITDNPQFFILKFSENR
ncbi:MAG: hypothetical protein L0Y74_03035, partial [candidate division Zixibacteria bacterium]|nr:hypothetical protein [candidate division Zixibacteria bacterium]